MVSIAKQDSVEQTAGSESGSPFTIVLPAKNESLSIGVLLARLRSLHPNSQLLVVDDGSRDDTATIARQAGAIVISHPYSLGNGAAIKTGARHAAHDIVVFMDADGQHDPDDIARLLSKLDDGFDMAVGSRGSKSQASMGRSFANGFYNRFASWVVGHRIADLTSGFRAARTRKFREFLHLLPNGFSYPTTITMCFFRSGYAVGYVPITAHKRKGTSHIRPLRDGMRFMLIMIRVGTLYAPLKIFLPISLTTLMIGVGYYAYTYTAWGRFTNMSGLLMTSALIVFLIGLVSEQITMLLYKKENDV
jgi:glycosyltransferase involved in cell wall biosynthesis